MSLPGDIFISYRREDSQAYAGRLFDHLEQAFGADRVFFDVYAIEPGLDFAVVLGERLQSCKIVLAIIGSRWSSVTDPDGKRRLEDPDDFVRIELETALARGIRVVPVLVDRAEMPARDSLPASLAGLAARQAVRLTHERFAADTDGLIKALARVIAPEGESNPDSATGQSSNIEQASEAGWSAKWTKTPSMLGWSMVVTKGTRHHVFAGTLEGLMLDGEKIAEQPVGFNPVIQFKVDDEDFELNAKVGLLTVKTFKLSVGDKTLIDWKND